MTDRIAELRALRQAERSALGGNDLMPWASAADVLRGALHDDCDALLDCAEALRRLLQDTQHAEHECGDAQCPVAAALAATEVKR